MVTKTKSPIEKRRLENLAAIYIVRTEREEKEKLKELELPVTGGSLIRKFLALEVNLNGEKKTTLITAKYGEEKDHYQISERGRKEIQNSMGLKPEDRYQANEAGGGILYIDHNEKSINFGDESVDYGPVNPKVVKALLIEGFKDKYKGYRILYRQSLWENGVEELGQII